MIAPEVAPVRPRIVMYEMAVDDFPQRIESVLRSMFGLGRNRSA